MILKHLSPLYDGYVKQTEQGTKPPMAKLTLARRIAAATLAVYSCPLSPPESRERNPV